METNSRGNQVERSFLPTERYRWDFDEKLTAAGWEQYDTDQDAWYFGVWLNKKTLQIRTYAEGDITLTTCPDAEHFNAEIKAMNEFYGEGFIAKTIDENGQMTVYRQDRNQFFIKEREEVKDGSVL
jgi:hypothetical protein